MIRPLIHAAAVTAIFAAGCVPTGPERAAYLTLIGNDTLVMERMEFGEGYVEAQAIIRGSRTTFGEYRLETSPTGEVTGYTARTYAGGDATGELLLSETLQEGGSGPVLSVMRNGEEQTRDFAAEAGAVPFIDMLHWPFEAAFRRQAAAGGISDAVTTFSGRGMRFEVAANQDGSRSIIHPSRGPSTAHLDADGRILSLDGTGSTRAYDLTRKEWDDLDFATLGAAFADRPLGELSGRGEIDADVGGAHFVGDYGTPMRRGREIFGSLLAYGARWRTGANRATHLAFDRDLEIDGVVIPAGEY
ncbi:MAG: DUF2911 domain-containing protein, partial [Gemmatimonadota bacterium]|nr:DUF2911 domain-containing protein [Gemmatimonadota bacterium]